MSPERQHIGDAVGGDKAGRDAVRGDHIEHHYSSPELSAINTLITDVTALETRLDDREIITREQVQGLFRAVGLLSERVEDQRDELIACRRHLLLLALLAAGNFAATTILALAFVAYVW